MDIEKTEYNKSELYQLFISERQIYNSNPYSDYKTRIKLLQLLRKAIINNQQQLIDAINQDFGHRPKVESQVLEIFPSLECIDFAIKNLKKWMKPRSHKTSKWFWPSRSYVLPIPRGVVGIISPWNYPLFLTIAPLVAAIAAGNRVMIKLSEHVPKTSVLLKNLLAPFATVVLGDANVSAEFSGLPFDHLLFTGASPVGKKVMHTASQNLTSLTLELGGKSPAIIAPNELNSHYVNNIWLGKIINAGQTCIAPDYLMLPKGLANILLSKSIDSKCLAGVTLTADNYCSIINKTNYNRLLNLIDDAIHKGATWHPLLESNENNNSDSWHSSQNNIYKISPGLLLNANFSMEIMQQEIFGPVLPVIEYTDIDELLDLLHNTERPLAIYLFSNNKMIQQKFLQATHSGAIGLNATVVHAAQESLPFGGIGNSGFGSYRGQYGFDTFSLLKPVYKQSKSDMFSKFYPPNKLWQKLLLKLMINNK